MGAIYEYPITRTALNTSNDLITIVVPSTAAARVLGFELAFDEITAALNEIRIARSTSGTTPGGGITAGKKNAKFANATLNVYTTWSAQPTLGEILRRYSLKAPGERAGGLFTRDGIIDIPPSGQISVRSSSGTSNVSGYLLIEEI